MKVLGVVALLSACTAQPPAAVAVESPTYDTTWASSLVCTDTIGHPCPYLVLCTLATLNPLDASRVAITWWGPSVATDRGPDPDEETLAADGSITLAVRSDEAGERQAGSLRVTPDGYEGDVTWLLFTVAGKTTWHLTLTR